MTDVIQEEVNILCILPQRFLYFLNVSSSIELLEYKSFNQLSVSTHSLRAILNFDNISGKLWGYYSIKAAKAQDVMIYRLRDMIYGKAV